MSKSSRQYTNDVRSQFPYLDIMYDVVFKQFCENHEKILIAFFQCILAGKEVIKSIQCISP